ncbi:MAG TPA: FUSC family protein [Mycobacteriales bacterium]|nr:FUSC family protein [Mycobacteriales bacterium]
MSIDPGLARLRVAGVAMSAALLSFATALLLDHLFNLTTSSVVLAVVLALTLGRADRRGHESALARWLAPIAMPFLVVASTEVGKWMFTHPNFGDTLFAVGMAAGIWLRRFGPHLRRVGSLVSSAFLAMLVTPAPAVALGSNPPSRWWAAVIALVALGWLRLVQFLAERIGVLARAEPDPAVPVPVARTRRADLPWHRQVLPSTRMSLQMGVALGAAFACGRAAFGVHWTWVVLSAYIVGSGNRGRADVTYKAVLRIAGAACGTVVAELVSHSFPPHDDWSIVVLFAVLAVAMWLRPLSYAYWAAGMTSALALLYDFYGEAGTDLLATRLEGILLGASLGVLAAWLVLPIRNVDAVRRQLAIAFGTVAAVLASADAQPAFAAAELARFRAASVAADLAGASLRWLRRLPRRLRVGYGYFVAGRALATCAAELPVADGCRLSLEPDERRMLAADVAAARRALAATAGEEERLRLGETTQRIAEALSSASRGPATGTA